MLAEIILALYAIVILIYLFISFFIVYHMVRFSSESELNTVMLVFFVVVSAGLLFSNLLMFFSMDWNTILSKLLAF